MSLFLYSLTLQPSSALVSSIVGQFSGQRGTQEIITARGSRLDLFKPDVAAGTLSLVASQDTFSIIRGILPFRIAGSTKDHVIVASDSGMIAILEYKPEIQQFIRIHLESFGKTGIRRIVPGQFLAVDAKGRATMIASIERNKLVYVLNRDSQANITISSPLEAHNPYTLLFALVGLDVGYDNPVFAALEVVYTEADLDPSEQAYREIEKMLTYYELDLGLNHVVRRWSVPVARSANALFPVPGGTDGPSGVLVCSNNTITYRHIDKSELRVPIPRRKGKDLDAKRDVTITCGVMHRMKNAFFFLLQSEEGDVFKLTVDYNEEDVVILRIKYFDTLPLARSLNILKSGYLFIGSESGDHMLYQFEKLGDDENTPEFVSSDYSGGKIEQYPPALFDLHPLDNVVVADSVRSLHPLTESKVLNLYNEDSPQIFTISGQSSRSTFRTLRFGLEVNEVVSSGLPGSPSSVWTTKLKSDDVYDQYIILSFSNGTLILSIGETIEEVTDSGLLSSKATIAVQQIGEDALIQVHENGIRHIGKEINEWGTPKGTIIVAATTNNSQVAVALSNNEIVYFEIDEEGQLNEYEDHKPMPSGILCMSIGEVPEGRVRSPFLAVGCQDSTVRVISLDPDNTLEALSVQALTALPSSLMIMAMRDSTLSSSSTSTLYLHLGLQNGVYLRTTLDTVSGSLTDSLVRFLGPKAVGLFKVKVHENNCILALSTRPWLVYIDKTAYKVSPLSYPELQYASSFSSEQCPEGIVALQNDSLRILTVENLSQLIKQDCIPLAYTPRKFVNHPANPYFYVLESDNNTMSTYHKEISNGGSLDGDVPPEFGYTHKQHSWASCIEVIDPSQETPVDRVELQGNEAAFSTAIVRFDENGDEGGGQAFLAVGTAKDLVYSPNSHKGGFVHIYKFNEEGTKLELVHKTKVEEPPLAMVGFNGQLLVGVGKKLRLYSMGMKQLLKKGEVELNLNNIVSLQVQGPRVIAGDSRESVTYVVYKRRQNQFIPFADDIIARHTTCTVQLDYDTCLGGDKFGNLWVVRCPTDVSEEADEDPYGTYIINKRSYLNGAPNRLDTVCNYYLQDIPTSLQRAQLVPGGREIVVYSGIQGTIGALLPFTNKEDVDFFQQLEGLMRTEDPSITGRDHLIYRGYYVPVKNIIDGDFCERYLALSYDKKQSIASELDRTSREVRLFFCNFFFCSRY